jgi:hypothetical protein
MSSEGWTGKEKGFAYGPPMLRNTMLRKWDGGQGGGGVAGHLKLKFKLEGSGLEPDWYGASFGLKIFYVRIIIIRDIPVYVRIQVCT